LCTRARAHARARAAAAMGETTARVVAKTASAVYDCVRGDDAGGHINGTITITKTVYGTEIRTLLNVTCHRCTVDGAPGQVRDTGHLTPKTNWDQHRHLFAAILRDSLAAEPPAGDSATTSTVASF